MSSLITDAAVAAVVAATTMTRHKQPLLLERPTQYQLGCLCVSVNLKLSMYLCMNVTSMVILVVGAAAAAAIAFVVVEELQIHHN